MLCASSGVPVFPRSMTHLVFCFVLFCWFFRASPAAYGDSQVRGSIRTVASRLYHSHRNAESLTH